MRIRGFQVRDAKHYSKGDERKTRYLCGPRVAHE